MTVKILETVEEFNLNASETKKHLKNVQVLTMELLSVMEETSKYQITESYKEAVIQASLLHDIGKATIPKAILYKKGTLSESERMIVETHPLTGIYILKKIVSKLELEKTQTEEEQSVISNVILSHHERWDGAGYPNGLKGEEIPLESRIITIVDVYDALTNKRSYKKAWTSEEALSYLEAQTGKMFDPELVAYFIKMKQKQKAC